MNHIKNKQEKIARFHKKVKEAGKHNHFRFFFRYRYKKLTILILAVIASYFIFTNSGISSVITLSDELEYFGIFIAGILLSFGFSAPFATGFFLISSPESIIMAAIIASFGSLISDMLIFKFIKMSFMDEFHRLKKTTLIKELHSSMKNHIPSKIKIHVYYSIIGILIASPIPDEIGISLLAGMTKIKPLAMAVLSFVLHAIGIFILLTI